MFFKKLLNDEFEKEPGVNPDPVHPLPELTTWYTLGVHLLTEQVLTFFYLDEKECNEVRNTVYKQIMADDFVSNAYKSTFVNIQDSIIRISQIKFVMSEEVEK